MNRFKVRIVAKRSYDTGASECQRTPIFIVKVGVLFHHNPLVIAAFGTLMQERAGGTDTRNAFK